MNIFYDKKTFQTYDEYKFHYSFAVFKIGQYILFLGGFWPIIFRTMSLGDYVKSVYFPIFIISFVMVLYNIWMFRKIKISHIDNFGSKLKNWTSTGHFLKGNLIIKVKHKTF